MGAFEKQFWWWIFKFSQKAEGAPDKYPTVKKKILHFNNNHFMAKSLWKSTRKWSKLRSNYDKKMNAVFLTQIISRWQKKCWCESCIIDFISAKMEFPSTIFKQLYFSKYSIKRFCKQITFVQKLVWPYK